MVAAAAVEPEFVAVKAAMLPVPLAARPIDVLLFVHVYDVAPVPEKINCGCRSVVYIQPVLAG
jgi:hypothetical protein